MSYVKDLEGKNKNRTKWSIKHTKNPQSSQNFMKERKNLQNAIEYVLCWATLLGMGVALRVVCILSEAPLKKTDCIQAPGYQVCIISGLGMELASSTLSIEILSVTEPCGPWACCHGLWVFTHVGQALFRRTSFLLVLHPLLILYTFHL